MEDNCKNCGCTELDFFGDESVCKYCGSSFYKSSIDLFTESERSLLVKKGFRKMSHKAYIKKDKNLDFQISKVKDTNKYRYVSFDNSFYQRRSITTQCNTLSECTAAYDLLKNQGIKKKRNFKFFKN